MIKGFIKFTGDGREVVILVLTGIRWGVGLYGGNGFVRGLWLICSAINHLCTVILPFIFRSSSVILWRMNGRTTEDERRMKLPFSYKLAADQATKTYKTSQYDRFGD